MKKRGLNSFGQVSVFVILAIVIIVAGGIAYYISKTSSGFDKRFSSDAAVQEKFDLLKDSILDCVDLTETESLNTIGIQGGYYDKPEKYFDLEWAFIPYYYYEGISMAPGKIKVQGELAKFVNDNLPVCFEGIDKGDFSIDYKTPKTSVKINTNDVKFDIELPISINREGKTVMLDLKDAPMYFDLGLANILDLGKYIADEAVNDDKMVCLSCITKAAGDRNLIVDMVNLESAGTLVVITTNSTTTGEYAFEFLNKYKE